MKYIKTFESFLYEAKEVGDLYHFTDVNGLLGILNEDRMRSNMFDYISFTRNALLHDAKEYSKRNVRITFDGDEMSNRFKIKPFMFGIPLFGDDEGEKERRETYGEEREERILGGEIKGVKKYITRVEIIKGHEKKFDEKLAKENPGIEFDVADSFKTYHKSLMV